MKRNVVYALLVAMTLSLTACGKPTEKPEDKHAKTQTKANSGVFKMDVTASSDWTKEATPAIAHIKGSDKDKTKDNDQIDFYHAVVPKKENAGSSAVTLPVGDYMVEWISPLRKDDTGYVLYETGKPVTVTVAAKPEATPISEEKKPDVKSEEKKSNVKPEDKKSEEKKSEDKKPEDKKPQDVKSEEKKSEEKKPDGTSDETPASTADTTLKQSMTKIPADKVTEEMVKDVAKKVEDALKKGDESLKGSTAKDVEKKLENVTGKETKPEDKKDEKKSDEKKPEAKKPEVKKEEKKSEEKKTNAPNTSSKPGKKEKKTNAPNTSSKPGKKEKKTNAPNTSSKPGKKLVTKTRTEKVPVTKTRTETYTENVTKTREVPYQETVTKYKTIYIYFITDDRDLRVEIPADEVANIEDYIFDTYGVWGVENLHYQEMDKQVPYQETVTKYRTETYTEPVEKTRTVEYTEYETRTVEYQVWE